MADQAAAPAPKAESTPAPKQGDKPKKGGKKEKKERPKQEAAAGGEAPKAADPKEHKDDKPKKEKKKKAPKQEDGGKAEPKAEKHKEDSDDSLALEFVIPKAAADEKVTVQQIKSRVKEAFTGFGIIDEVRVTGEGDRQCIVFFSRVLGKGSSTRDAVKKGEKPTINIYGVAAGLAISNERGSGGGATSGTSHRPKKESKEPGKEGGGRGKGRRDRSEGGDAQPGDEKAKAERPKRPPPPKIGPIGRANGGPRPAKVVLPRSKEAKAKLEEEKRKKEKSGKKEGEEESGGGKKEAGKAEGGKKEGGKKEKAKKE